MRLAGQIAHFNEALSTGAIAQADPTNNKAVRSLAVG